MTKFKCLKMFTNLINDEELLCIIQCTVSAYKQVTYKVRLHLELQLDDDIRASRGSVMNGFIPAVGRL